MSNNRNWRLLAAILAFMLSCHAHGFAETRPVHLAYPNGNVDLYFAANRCAIVLDGLMDAGAAKALDTGFRQMQRMGCTEPVMVFNSAGGTPAVAYLLADFLAKHAFDTAIVDGGICFSACAYAFLGGRKRFIAERGRYGVHQHSRNNVCAHAFSDAEEQRMRRIMDRSLPAPAVNRLIGIVLDTDCNTMNFLSRADLSGMSIANVQESRLDKAIQQAMANREAQVYEQFRSAARGNWTRLAGDNVLVVFAREGTQPAAGGNPTVWGLINYSADKAEMVSGERYRSHEMLNEVDCEKQTISVIRGVYTRDAMGAGPVVWKTGRLTGVAVRPKTPAEALYKQACGQPLPG